MHGRRRWRTRRNDRAADACILLRNRVTSGPAAILSLMMIWAISYPQVRNSLPLVAIFVTGHTRRAGRVFRVRKDHAGEVGELRWRMTAFASRYVVWNMHDSRCRGFSEGRRGDIRKR
jgi:hypothetical protein